MKKIAICFLSLLFLLTGCNLFPDPESLIQPPKEAKPADLDEDLLSIARRNLPKGTELSVPNGPVGTESVINVDLDDDGKDEVLVLYKSTIHQNQVGAFVLKESKNGWDKVFAKNGAGAVISWASASDVTGDGRKEILLGWQQAASFDNTLEIFHWNEDKLASLKELNYNELEAIQFDNDPKIRLAIWKRDMADVYKIDLLGWNGVALVTDRTYYPSYFKRVIAYYQKRTSEVPDAAYYWYYLADAYVKANQNELALEAIEKGLKTKSMVPTKDFFEQLKKLAEKNQNNLGQTSESNIKFTSLEDELVIKRVTEAAQQYWYVMSGGKMPEGIVEIVNINNHEYRYLGIDLDTNAKMQNYLSSSYTMDAIQGFLRRVKIFEYFGRLIQQNADGGSILNYELAEIVQKKDKGNEKEFDIKVPVGNSLTYEVVHISFQKTENGWRIFSEPGTF
ncbi:MAG: DL-endopeptidase inhibitor IseA family protein [Neobacillus sp.]